MVVWDRKTLRPVHHAIVWQCRRSAGICEKLKAEGLEEMFLERSGLLLNAYFSGTKVKWLLDEIPGLRARAEFGELAFGTVDTWLIARLTGGRLHVTDYTNASRTPMFNIHNRTCDPDLLDVLDIPSALMPDVVASANVAGFTDADNVGAEIPIAGIAGDQQAALFGQACFDAGQAKNTYGTGCFLLLNVGHTRVDPGAVEAATGLKFADLRVDGGACRNDFLMQFQADLLGCPVDRSRYLESTGMGAAFLAGLAVGFWKSSAVVAALRSSEKIFLPKIDLDRRRQIYGGWRNAVGRVKSRVWQWVI